MKIEDRITLGMISGVLAGIPDAIVNTLEHKAGLTDLTYGRMGANIFLPQDKSHRPESLAAGYAANAAMTGFTGILFTYLLSATGRDHAVLKGIGMGLGTWMLVYGLGGKLGLTVKPKELHAPVLSLLDHIFFGSLLGLITPKLAADSLFPGEKRPALENTPENAIDNGKQTPALYPE